MGDPGVGGNGGTGGGGGGSVSPPAPSVSTVGGLLGSYGRGKVMNIVSRNTDIYLGSIAYESGTQKTFEIERTGFIKEIMLLLSGSLTIGTAAATGIPSESPASLLARIELFYNGSELIKSYDGAACYRLSCFDRTFALTRTKPGATVATHAFMCPLILQFRQPLAGNPVDTILPAFGFENLFLKVTWNPLSAIATPDATTVLSQTGTKVDIVGFYADIPHWSDKKFSLWKEVQAEKDLAASATEFPLDMVLGSLYRRIFLQTYQGSDCVDTILNAASLRSAVNVMHKIKVPRTVLKANGEAMYAFTPDAGNYMLELCDEGRLATAIPSSLVNSLQVILDVTKQSGTNTIKWVTGEILQPVPGRFIV